MQGFIEYNKGKLYYEKFGKGFPKAKNRLLEIKVPVLTVVGEKDLQYFHDISNFIKEHISNCRQVIIPNVGHMSNLEDPDKINKLIEEMIK